MSKNYDRVPNIRKKDRLAKNQSIISNSYRKLVLELQ